jgi:lipoyl(octanoyl) transferase
VIWNLTEYQSHTGKFNMEFDLGLVKKCSPNSAFLRFYGWEPHCISLGNNQSYEDINLALTSQNNIEVVKRPTGGRAILHSEELTYSVVISNQDHISGRFIYEKISEAIVEGLRKYNFKLNLVSLENQQPNFPEQLKKNSGSICFASTAKSEIKFGGKKLVGSAQRKLGNTILQHGSILIGKNHQSIVDYLNIEEGLKPQLRSEMDLKTTQLSTIINEDVNIFELQNCIILGFEDVFCCEFVENELSPLPI